MVLCCAKSALLNACHTYPLQSTTPDGNHGSLSDGTDSHTQDRLQRTLFNIRSLLNTSAGQSSRIPRLVCAAFNNPFNNGH